MVHEVAHDRTTSLRFSYDFYFPDRRKIDTSTFSTRTCRQKFRRSNGVLEQDFSLSEDYFQSLCSACSSFDLAALGPSSTECCEDPLLLATAFDLPIFVLPSSTTAVNGNAVFTDAISVARIIAVLIDLGNVAVYTWLYYPLGMRKFCLRAKIEPFMKVNDEFSLSLVFLV